MDPYIGVGTAADPVGLRIRREQLKSRWRMKLQELHRCRMKASMAAALMVDKKWAFDRDVDFAMSTLLPQTIDILTSGRKPTIDELKSIPWIDTKDPVTYFCLVEKLDRLGNVIERGLKVGCAWSEDGGARRRRTDHDNPINSIKWAKEGSPFHALLNSAAKDETIHKHWGILSRGAPFQRTTDADDYLAARYFQVEAMLSAALGASKDGMNNPEYLAMKWWAADPQVDAGVDDEVEASPWDGLDSHCAMEDRFARRSSVPVESRAQTRLAVSAKSSRMYKAKAVANDKFLCTYVDCERSQPGNGFPNSQNHRAHLKWHEKNPGKRQVGRRKCEDPRCKYEAPGSLLWKHEKTHVDGKVSCAACGLKSGNLSAVMYHARNFCYVDGAEQIMLAWRAENKESTSALLVAEDDVENTESMHEGEMEDIESMIDFEDDEEEDIESIADLDEDDICYVNVADQDTQGDAHSIIDVEDDESRDESQGLEGYAEVVDTSSEVDASEMNDFIDDDMDIDGLYKHSIDESSSVFGSEDIDSEEGSDVDSEDDADGDLEDADELLKASGAYSITRSGKRARRT